MSVRTLVLAAAASLAGFAAVPAFAADFDVTADNQMNRIRQGVRSGALTRVEAARLQDEQDHIRHMIRTARLDGRVDAYERARIERAQEIASRRIFAEKHDIEHRPVHRRWWPRWNRWN